METTAMRRCLRWGTMAAVAASVAALAGCGAAESVESAEMPPPPPLGEGVELLPAWKARTNNVMRLNANFSKTLAARTIWDIPMPMDLGVRSGIQFDFWCDDIRPFSGFSCYFKSGKGWYHGTFSPEESGRWQRVRVRKSDVRTEDVPDGWGAISQIRISGWRAELRDAKCAIANLSYLGGGKPDVAIVYAGSLAAAHGAAGRAYLSFAGTVSATLESLGLSCSLVSDTELTPAMLADVQAAVLPYNSSMPPAAFSAVKGFVASGRRVLACYSLPGELAELMGLRQKGVVKPPKPIAGFLKSGAGLPGQPSFAPQASWMTQRVELPPFGGDVLATWATGNGEPVGIPALARTPAGIYMAHVWLGGTDGAQAELMRAIACDLAPSLKSKMDAHAAELDRRDGDERAWLAAQKPKDGEHRAFWCHSAYGLGGGRTWDESVRFLKENGFNVLLPNLAWGGVAFYASDVLPTAAEVAQQGDALAQCLAACRKYGVGCHVWKVCWNMGSHVSKSFEDVMVASNRTQVSFGGKPNSRWLCPSHPDNQKLEIDAMAELAKKGVDGVHLDYIRYPDISHCFCAGCKARFEAFAGGALTNWPAAVRSDERLKAMWLEFRTSNITAVVRGVAERVRAESPGVKVSAAVFSNVETSPGNVGQDWAKWCEAGWLDFVCPMDYEDSPALFRNMVARQKSACGRARLYPGIGLSVWRGDTRQAVTLAKQIIATRELGLGGFTVFNFDRRAEKVVPLVHLGVTRDR